MVTNHISNMAGASYLLHPAKSRGRAGHASSPGALQLYGLTLPVRLDPSPAEGRWARPQDFGHFFSSGFDHLS